MRWEQSHGGYVLRVAGGFAGLVYPLTGGRWIGEVFGADLAAAGSLQDVKWFVVTHKDEGRLEAIQ